MRTSFAGVLGQALTIRFRPTRDLAAVAVSWLLVVGALYTATAIVGVEVGGGLPYFGLYAMLAATLLGVGIPVYWTVVLRRRPLDDLGLTRRRWGLSLVLQVVFASLQFMTTLARVELPPITNWCRWRPWLWLLASSRRSSGAARFCSGWRIHSARFPRFCWARFSTLRTTWDTLCR